MFGKPAETTVQLAAGERKFLHFDFSTGLLANVFFIGDTLKVRNESAALEDLKELSSAKAPSAGKDR